MGPTCQPPLGATGWPGSKFPTVTAPDPSGPPLAGPAAAPSPSLADPRCSPSPSLPAPGASPSPSFSRRCRRSRGAGSSASSTLSFSRKRCWKSSRYPKQGRLRQNVERLARATSQIAAPTLLEPAAARCPPPPASPSPSPTPSGRR